MGEVASLGQFAANIRAIASTIERRASVVQRSVAVTVLQTIVMATPVGNKTLWEQPQRARPGYVGGRARNNWMVGVGAPTSGTTDEVDASGAGAVSRGKDAIEAAEGVINITNNLPYIVPLNEGHSHQAPAGFVEQAVLAGVNALRGQTITRG